MIQYLQTKVYFISSVLIMAAGCGMPIGFSTVILPQLYNSSDELQMDLDFGSWFASVHSLSSPFGSFCSGPLMDQFGRKPGLMIATIPLVLGWILIALAASRPVLLAGRILAGISVGLMAAPAQILIAECAEPKLRGFLIGVPFVSYAFGILLTYLLGVLLNWRTVAWCCNILPLVSLVALYLVPESPVWLVRKGFITRAEKALKWLRCNDLIAKTELQELIRRCDNESLTTTANESILRACTKSSVLKPLIIVNLFHTMMILSGTYLIVFYAVDIISEFGTDVDSMTAAVYTAVTRLIFTICACFLLYHLNRRTLGILSGLGSGLSTLILAIFNYVRLGQPKTTVDTVVPAICIICYVAANTSFMVMPGVMVGELLPAQIRGRVAGYIFTGFNLFFFVVAKIFPYVSQRLKSHGVFLMFGIASFGASLVTYLLLPETKGKTLGEIEDYFQEKNWFWTGRKGSKEKESDGKV
ncbi:hypothetical protein HA402_008345 [Bradysia odoriphaga]|nr:hypothetical protein HA402_008345 [Bradysia odoriphaga]